MFSVVIPLYNKAHTIVRTLGTVFNQSYKDFEIIIVNDGSTDDGIEKILAYTTDKRIRIVTQENQGVSAARNKGVKLSSFEYIAFLDGDDEWMPDYLLKIKEAINLFPQAGMYCCAGIVRNADETEGLRLANQFKNKIVEIDFFENPHVFLHTSATVVAKKEFFKTAGFPVGMKKNEDFALFFSLALLTPVVYCGIPLSIYVGGVAGQATSIHYSKVMNHQVNRFNHVFGNWLKSSFEIKTVIIFTKYEIRHLFLTYLKDKDYHTIQYFKDELDSGIMGLFPVMELKLMEIKFLRKVAIVYIILTKIRWRLRGYPRVS